MAHIVTDDRKDNVVIQERETKEVERVPARTTGGSIGGIIFAILIVLVLLYLLRGIF